jgi:hypothetical protein
VLTTRARKIIIWAGILVLLLPLAFMLFGDISALIDNIELLASLVLILWLAIVSWRLKQRLKGRMQRGLGRSVEDHELTSITAWMRIPEHAAKAGKDSEEYDFND